MGSSLGRSAHADPQLTRHFDRLFPTLGELEAAADAARSLISSSGWPVLLDLLGAEVSGIDAKLDSGRPLEHVEYAAYHGRRGGLRAPAAMLHALIDRAESRLAEQRAKHEGDAEPSPGEG